MTVGVLVAMDGTPSHMKMPSASKLRPSPAIPGSMEAAIKMWLQVGNVQKLQQAVLDGYGWLLEDKNSRLPHVNKFLKKVPNYQEKIDLIHEQVIRGDKNQVYKLLDKKGWANARDHYGHSALHKSVMANQGDIMKFLLHHHPEHIEDRDNEGRTPLHYAAALQGTTGGHNPLYNTLVEAGASEDVVDVQGHSAGFYRDHPQDIRHRTIQSRKPPPLSTHLMKGDPDSATSPIPPPNRAYLRTLIHNGDLEHLEKVVLDGHGAKLMHETSALDKVSKFIYALPDFMDTIAILHNATTAGVVPVVAELLTSERLCLSRDQYGATPLHKAVLYYQPKLVKLIADKFRIATRAKDQEGRTPLHYSAALRDSGIFYRYLLKCGADENIQDKYGKTAKFYVYAPGELDLNVLIGRCKEMPRKRDPEGKSQKFKMLPSQQMQQEAYSHATPPKVLSTQVLRNLIRQSDLDGLEKVVLDGHGGKLIGENASDSKIRTFIKAVPSYLRKIEVLHEAVVNGDINGAQSHLTRRKLAVSKDENGHGLLHKAVYHGHTDIVYWLLENYPETVDVKDWDGRIPIHYATANANAQQLLSVIQHYGDPTTIDNYEHSYEYYQDHQDEVKIPEWQPKWTLQPDAYPRSPSPERKSTVDGKSQKSSTGSQPPSPVKLRSRRGVSSRSRSISPMKQLDTSKDKPKKPGAPVINGKEINNNNIRTWIHAQDIAALEKVLFEGEGHLLLKHASAHPKIRKFLESVPRLMNDIKDLHYAAVTGDVDLISHKEFRQQVYLSKDQNGLSAFHKSVANGNKLMSEHLLEKTDRGVINQVERTGKTALHYAAANESSGGSVSGEGLYGWLLTMGADKEHEDNNMKDAEYYSTKGSADIDPSFCNFVPDAPRITALTKSNLSASDTDGDASDTKRKHSKERKPAAEVRSSARSPKKKRGPTTKPGQVAKSKADILLHTTTLLKSITEEQINKLVKEGDVAKLENAVLLGKGKLIIGKKAWNEKTRKFIKTVPDLMNDIEALHKAAGGGDQSKVKEIISKNKRLVYTRDSSGSSPIHKAAKGGHAEVVKYIISENPESLKITDNDMRSVLHYSARCENAESRTIIDEECTTHGADKFLKDSLGNAPDYYITNEFPQPTIKRGRVSPTGANEEEINKAIDTRDVNKLVDYILDGDADKLRDRSSDDEEVQELIDGVPKFEDKIAAIHEAVENGSLEELKTNLTRKKYALAKDRQTGASILHKAVVYGHLDIVRFICEHTPLTLTIQDNVGRTALHYAAALNDNGEAFGILEEYGADGNKEDEDGRTPEYYTSNRDELSHGELLDFVKGKFSFDTDAATGRSDGEEE